MIQTIKQKTKIMQKLTIEERIAMAEKFCDGLKKKMISHMKEDKFVSINEQAASYRREFDGITMHNIPVGLILTITLEEF